MLMRADLSGLLHPVETVLGHLPVVELDEIAAGKVAHGNPVEGLAGGRFCNGDEVLLTRSGAPLAIAQVKDAFIQPLRVFQFGD